MKKRLWKRWYPRSWRNRYGEEYEQLLEDLAADNQMTWRSEVNVAQTGLALRRVYPGRRIALGIGTAAIVAVVAFAVGFGIRGTSAPHASFAIQRCTRVAPAQTSTPAAAQAKAKAFAAAAKAAGQVAKQLPKGSAAVHISVSTACPGGAFRIVGPVTFFLPGRIITPRGVLAPGALSTPAGVHVQQAA